MILVRVLLKVRKAKKNVCVLSSPHMSAELGESEKKKPETVKSDNNVVLTCLVKWPCSIQPKQAPVGGPLPFSTTFWIWQASMHLYSTKKRTGDKVSRQGFLFKLATELREDYIVERSTRNATIARPHSLSQLLKKPKLRSVNSVK